MTVVDLQTLQETSQIGDVVGVQRLLRWGPFAQSNARCAPPPETLTGLRWMRVDRLAIANDTPDLGAVLRMLGRTNSTVAVVVGAARNETVALWLGFDPSGASVEWVRNVASPSTRLVPTDRPGALAGLGGAFQAGLALRLGLGNPPRDSMTVRLLESLLAIPEDEWCLLLHLQPVPEPDVDVSLAALQNAERALAEHLTSQRQTTEALSSTLTRSDVRRSMDWLDILQSHGATARAAGGWLMGAWIGAPEPATAMAVAAAVSEATTSWGSERSRWTTDRLTVGDRYAPPPASFISSEELTLLLQPPRSSIAGIRVMDSVVGGRRVPPADKPLPLGTRVSSDDSVALDVADLEGHGFVSGTTGSGKSTTVQRLLVELWNRHRIPFLILDPVKDDYDSLGRALDGGIHVLPSRDLQLNVLEPWNGFDRTTHTDSIAALFKGAFSMPSPIPYVADRLFRTVAAEARVGSLPTLYDIADGLDALVTSLGYSSEVESNIRAALGTRLALLLEPSRAEQMAAPDNRAIEGLFDAPTVVTLGDTADPDARGFLMAALALIIGERARTRSPSSDVRHVTVLEEAHVILPEPSPAQSQAESGDSSSAASRVLSRMLAEVRAFGEALIVVDQSPSSVARQVVKNTNLKIAHRVLDPADRDVLGGALGLDDEASRSLVALDVGEAVVSSARILEPVMISVDRLRTDMSTGAQATRHPPASFADDRPCCGSMSAETHHRAEQRGHEAEDAMAHFIGGIAAGVVTPDRLRVIAGQRLEALQSRYPGVAGDCLAFVGLRRAIEGHVRTGLMPVDEAVDVTEQLWTTWEGIGDATGLREGFRRSAARDVGPFPGCVTCTARCRFRALSESISHGGVDEARRILPSGRFVGSNDQIREWIRSSKGRLGPWLGEDATHAIRCSLVQALSVQDSSWATTEWTFGLLDGLTRDDPDAPAGERGS